MPLLGTETEYGILAPGRPELHPATLSAAVVNGYPGPATRANLDWRGPIPIEDANNRFLGNGARLYVDHAHPEYSAPETTSPWQAMLCDLAGDEVMRAGAAAASEVLETPVQIFRNNTDGKGASYGYHENYLLSRSTPWDAIVAGFLPFTVSRLPLIGAGRVGLDIDSGTPGYQISQRADFFEALVGLETTIRRPLINTRDEPHADPKRWRRLHVISGDANRSHTSTLVKLGSAAAVLAAIEAGGLRPVALADPLAAVRIISRDLTCRATVELSDGRHWTALDIQDHYLEQVRAAGVARKEILALWGELIDDLRADVTTTADRLDWVAKLGVLRAVQQRDGGSAWDSPRLAQIDLAWADLDDRRSVYAALVRRGAMKELVSPAEIAEALAVPPSDTRARLRGRMIADHPDAVLSVDWDSITVRTRHGRRRIAMPDPFETGDDLAIAGAAGGDAGESAPTR